MASLLRRAASSAVAAPRLFSGVAQPRFASTLVVADHDHSSLNPSTLSVITAAKKVGGPVSVLVAGKGCDAVGAAAAAVDGVDEVFVADDPAYEHFIAENITGAVLALQGEKSFSHIFTSSTNTAKNFMPRIAACLDCAPVSDVLTVESENTFTRPTYAGNAIAKVTSSDSVKVASVRTTAFEKATAEGGSASVSAAPAAGDAGMSAFVSEEKVESDRPELTAASIVIAGGRGLKNGENFEMLYKLADKLGGAVGASRAAVDAGFVPNDMQIGQTGKVVAPDLYVAVGISGAIQHLAGMKDSKTIVAINKDPEAPIFQVADYGLVDDLFNAVPELDSKL